MEISIRFHDTSAYNGAWVLRNPMPVIEWIMLLLPDRFSSEPRTPCCLSHFPTSCSFMSDYMVFRKSGSPPEEDRGGAKDRFGLLTLGSARWGMTDHVGLPTGLDTPVDSGNIGVLISTATRLPGMMRARSSDSKLAH
jgi:hypothetical protein